MAQTGLSQRLWVIRNEVPELDEAKEKFLLARHCTAVQAQRIKRYRRSYDKRNALISHMLQRHACFELGKIPPERVAIERTKGDKPFLAVEPAAHCPNFNFNPSHDGKYVLLAASTHFLIGADVHQMLPPGKSIAFLEDGYTPSQRQQAEQLSPSARRVFTQVLFSLKEAYVKALGVGRMLSFDTIDFSPPLPVQMSNEPREGARCGWRGRIHHVVNGRASDRGEWCLELQWVDEDHIAAVAIGDVEKAVDDFGFFALRLTKPGLRPTTDVEASCGPAQHISMVDLLHPQEREAFEACDTSTVSSTENTEEQISRLKVQAQAAAANENYAEAAALKQQWEAIQNSVDKTAELREKIGVLQAAAKLAADKQDYEKAAALKEEWLALEATLAPIQNSVDKAAELREEIGVLQAAADLAAEKQDYEKAAALKEEWLALEATLDGRGSLASRRPSSPSSPSSRNSLASKRGLLGLEGDLDFFGY